MSFWKGIVDQVFTESAALETQLDSTAQEQRTQREQSDSDNKKVSQSNDRTPLSRASKRTSPLKRKSFFFFFFFFFFVKEVAREEWAQEKSSHYTNKALDAAEKIVCKMFVVDPMRASLCATCHRHAIEHHVVCQF
jgi:hypothetical protein